MNLFKSGCLGPSACALVLALFSQQLRAQFTEEVDDTLTFYGTSVTAYDSNLFRLPETTSSQLVLGENHRSDFIETGILGMHLDKLYGQQQLVGDASYTYAWYQTFDYLNAGSTNFDLAWKWHLTPRVSGNLSASRREVPSDFDFYRGFRRRNYNQQQDYKLRVDANPFGGWHLIGGGGFFVSSSSVSTGETPRSNQGFVDGGLGYTTAGGSKFQGVGRYGSGQYAKSTTPQFSQARDFKSTSGEFQYFSQPTRVTTLKLVAGYISRTHKDFSARNYSGWTADSSVGWSPTAKLLITGRLQRGIDTYQDAYFTDYSREDFTLSPQWLATDKISLSGTFGYSRYKFGGFSATTPEKARTDRLGIYSFGASWVPSSSVTIKASFSNRVRDSSFDVQELDYRDSITSLTTTLSF